MASENVSGLLSAMLKAQGLSKQLKEELRDYEADLNADVLNDVDQKYVVALAKRLGIKGVRGGGDDSDSRVDDSLSNEHKRPDDPEALRTRISELEKQLATAQDRVAELEREGGHG